MSEANFLVTGALGCLGAWIVRNLVQSGINVTIYDLGTNLQRLQLLMTDEEIAAIRFAQIGDVTNLDMLKRTLMEYPLTNMPTMWRSCSFKRLICHLKALMFSTLKARLPIWVKSSN